jgi:ATP-dependent Lon protease
MMLDEIDKVGGDFRGDPYSALLEVLDPAQNSAFVDHYINVPFDLSKVMFICTANVLDTLPAPLRDRMEVIVLSGYTPHEKLQIAQLHLVPRALDDLGLQSEHIRFDDTALEFIIAGYTRDAGTRSLERAIRSILRKVARKLAESDGDAAAFGTIDRDRVRALLGHPQHPEETAIDLDEPGSALGLAWTPAGGELLVIEAAAVPGGRGLTLTGQLGDVMKESAAAALTWVRAHVDQLGADRQRLEQSEVHLHVPAGAIPKDGPSAGVAMCAALVSLFTGRMPKPRVAMTGEITLRGRVLPIGGVKLKVLGAHRLGIRTVILPKGNEHDLEEIPEDARNGLDFVLVEKIADVLDAAMEPQKVDQSAA